MSVLTHNNNLIDGWKYEFWNESRAEVSEPLNCHSVRSSLCMCMLSAVEGVCGRVLLFKPVNTCSLMRVCVVGVCARQVRLVLPYIP